MKNWITPLIVLAGLLIYLVSLRGDAPGSEAEERFAQASAFYEGGEFAKAESSYHTLIEDGQKSSAVYYNLALTQEALEQPGKAILNLERAATLDPGSPEVRDKLAELRKNNGSSFAEPAFWQSIPVRWWTVTGALAVLVLVLLPLSRLLKFPHGPPAITAGICLAIIGASAWFIHDHDQRNHERAIILNPDTPLRMSPFEGAESQQTLAPGQAVKAVENKSHDDFLLVETTDGNTGWVQSKEVSKVTD